MQLRKATSPIRASLIPLALSVVFFLAALAFADDLPDIKKKGVLRHLGVPYANFVTGSGDGLDVEMVKLFADYLGVKYEYVQTSWDDVIGDISGKKVKVKGDEPEIIGDVPVRGDIAANGLTILPWREKVVAFSVETFPNQVWLIANADSAITPISPSGDMVKDISTVKSQVKGCSILGIPGTCLDPRLYGLSEAQANIIGFNGSLNDLVPALVSGKAEATIQDVSDALMALDKWPGKIKIIGPVSPMQNMGYAFSKNSPQLREAFNEFYNQCKKDGTYSRIVMKYYPAIVKYYPEFFQH